MANGLDTLFYGGVHRDWITAARAAAEGLVASFPFDLAFASLGDIEAIEVARLMARRSHVPWVADIKDPIARFIPALARPVVLHRLRSAAAVTYNSDWQADQSARFGLPQGLVVRSGSSVTPDFGPLSPEILLVGSVYDPRLCREALAAAGEALSGSGLRLRYLGPDSGLVMAAAADVVDIDIAGLQDRPDYLRACARATAVFYVGATTTYHHKAVELMATGRPVFAYGSEAQENIALAARIGADFRVTRDAGLLQRAFKAISAAPPPTRRVHVEPISWAAAARALEAHFESVVFARGRL